MSEHIGEFVCAVAGRDKGKYFIAVSGEGEYLFICDGKSRKVGNPKKKKLKHMSLTGISDEFIVSKLDSQGKLTNKEVRYALSNFLRDNADV